MDYLLVVPDLPLNHACEIQTNKINIYKRIRGNKIIKEAKICKYSNKGTILVIILRANSIKVSHDNPRKV